ncbi:hypothetical protein ElyMa_000102300 [Elysia marginata]|uniref:Amine oxidase n=1 Tax=Elysia marginata TaxID=1093978 RepID=A0AAV4EL13_9GAST|nr:hypothetical protein ElyMa_000102300 [Elysia marginata]
MASCKRLADPRCACAASVVVFLVLACCWDIVTSSGDPSLDAINIESAVQQLKQALQGLEKQTTRNKLVVKDLTRQTLMNRFQAEERIRSEGDSGIVQVRYDKLGSRNYHHTTFIGNSFVAVHDHSDTIDTCGMGEFIGILNGVEFRTRHNDYRLVMPSRSSKAWHAYDEIPTPPVPQSVLDKPTLEEQILEMREYFKAFRDQNITHRDYRPHFKPVLAYLEGAWTVSAPDKIEESFDSDRHRLDANSWFDMQERIRYTSTVGTKDPDENFANLPTSIIGINPDNDEPIYVQWNYRIMGWPIDIDIPTKYMKFEDDLMVRLPRGYSVEEAKSHRTAHFRFDEKDTPSYTVGETLLDKIIAKIPGKDNIPDLLTDDIFGNNLYHEGFDNLTLLNLGYYNHWFKHNRPGAMGTSVVLRGFSDANTYVAYNTQPRVAPLSFTYCAKRMCNSVDTRVSWMVPIEVIYLSPLMTWNPYNIYMQEGRNHKEFPSKYAEHPNRDGSNHPDKAFNGTNFRNFYRVPSEFYEKVQGNEDPADTAKSGVYVLDQQGNIRRCEASGLYLKTPNIPGVGRVRLRYPIAPIHQYGSPVWKELNAFKDTFQAYVNSVTVEAVTFEVNLTHF